MDSKLSDIGQIIIKAAYNIRNMYGPFLSEKYYEIIMEYEMNLLGLDVKRQIPVPMYHRGIKLPTTLAIDTLVNDTVIIEYKALKFLKGEEYRQLLTYMKLTNKKLGYIINFGAPIFKPTIFKKDGPLDWGIYRLVNNYPLS